MYKTVQGIALSSVLLLLTSCNWGEKLVYQKYIFPYRTVVNKLEGECSQSWTDDLKFFINDKESEWVNKRVQFTPNEEQEWGEKIHKAELEKYVVKDAVQQERVDNIVKKMLPFLKNKRFQIKAYIINMPIYNAFSLIGGRLYFTQTLLNEVSDEELVFIVGHEIGHLENAHSVEKVKLYKAGGLLGQLFFNVLFSGSNQKAELEADYAGAYLASKAGFDPRAGETLFQRWSEKEGEKTASGDFFRSHPYSSDRGDCLAAYINHAETEALEHPQRIVLIPLVVLVWKAYPTLLTLAMALLIGFPLAVYFFVKKNKWRTFGLGLLVLLAGLYFAMKQQVNFCYGDARANIADKRHPQPVNIRTAPEIADNNVADQMPDNEPVTVYFAGPKDKVEGKEGRWCLVSRGEVNGWVWGSKLILE
jgi:Peptidase family M48